MFLQLLWFSIISPPVAWCIAWCVARGAPICGNAYGGWFTPHARHSVRMTCRPSAALRLLGGCSGALEYPTTNSCGPINESYPILSDITCKVFFIQYFECYHSLPDFVFSKWSSLSQLPCSTQSICKLDNVLQWAAWAGMLSAVGRQHSGTAHFNEQLEAPWFLCPHRFKHNGWWQ